MNAKWITAPGAHSCEHPSFWPAKIFNGYQYPFDPQDGIIYVKKEFDLACLPASALLKVTALGIFDLFLNGQRIGSEELKPGWTDYNHRVFLFTYDIAPYLKKHNLLVASVSSGWWNGRITRGYYQALPAAFLASLSLDGEETLSTDESWDVLWGGPVRRADIYDGEFFDATLPDPCTAPEGYRWDKALLFDGFKGKCTPPEGPPVTVREDLRRFPFSAKLHEGSKPDGSQYGEAVILKTVTGGGCEAQEVRPGQGLIMDFGQNLVGVPEFTLKAPRGTRIDFYFAEMLNDSGDPARGSDGPKGSMYLANYRSAMSRLTYIASGEGEEHFFPAHVFYGFRYLELRADQPVRLCCLSARVLTSVTKETGFVRTSNSEVNRLIANIQWGMRSNYLSVPTDCPQRDERLGWTGDTQIFSGAACYFADAQGFLRKWLTDLSDGQVGHEGNVGDVIPRLDFGGSNAAWGDAAILVPWKLYTMYADTDILARQWKSMEDYMDDLARKDPPGPTPTYGDWLNYDITDKRYISDAFYAYDALLMEKIAIKLDKTDAASRYHALREALVLSFRKNYLPSGELTVKTQTGCLLALAFDLLSAEERPAVTALLRRAIEKNNYTLSTGFVGTGILNQTLASLGMDDLCYSLLLQTNDPGWLYSVRQGATTVWERWNSYTRDKGFGDVTMNSFNHYSYGAVAEWMFASMLGILPDPENGGFDSFVLVPTPDLRRGDALPCGQTPITWAEGRYKTPAGEIESRWESENDLIRYTFRIPGSSRAEVRLLGDPATLTLNGFPAEGLSFRSFGKRFTFFLSGGEYVLTVKK